MYLTASEGPNLNPNNLSLHHHMRRIFTLLLTVLLPLSLAGQKTKFTPEHWGLVDGKTVIKANITSPIFRNYSVAVERILSRGLGLQLGANIMPRGPLPLVPAGGALQMESEWVNFFSLSSFSLTPELRWYTGGGYGHGFYLMGYWRYERYRVGDYGYHFDLERLPNGTTPQGSAVLSGKLDTYSLGMGLGAQWLFGRNKNIVLDWNILGAHIGRGKLGADVVYHLQGGGQLPAESRETASRDILAPLSDLAFLNFDGARGELDEANSTVRTQGIGTPWAFFRMSLSVGFRF